VKRIYNASKQNKKRNFFRSFIFFSYLSVQWNKNPYFNLGLTIGYFWVTLLVMFILYFFIYEVASALEKRSQANAKKVSNLIGISSSTMTNLVINMSKNHQTAISSSSSPRPSKKKKKQSGPSVQSSPSKRRTSIEDDPGSSVVNNNNNNNNTNQNGPDMTNRSSSNETSGEHTPISVVAPNISNILALSKVGIESSKQLDENRTLLPNIQNKDSIATSTTAAHKKSSGSSSKARKALRTITVIMGAFVLCWTPVSI